MCVYIYLICSHTPFLWPFPNNALQALVFPCPLTVPHFNNFSPLPVFQNIIYVGLLLDGLGQAQALGNFGFHVHQVVAFVGHLPAGQDLPHTNAKRPDVTLFRK